MEVIVCRTADEVAEVAAAKVARVCRDVGPAVVIGVATGSSPVALYESLAQRVKDGRLDMSQASAFALDEYVGLPPGHPESYAEVIRQSVTEPLRMNPALVHTPNGFATDIEQAVKDYEQAIWFITQVRRLVGSDLEALERAMVAAAEALPIDELYAAPPPTMLMVGGDQAVRRRR